MTDWPYNRYIFYFHYINEIQKMVIFPPLQLAIVLRNVLWKKCHIQQQRVLYLFYFLFYLFATHNKIHNKQEC